MSAAELIRTAIITPPLYDDSNLGNESLWVLDNAARLAQYWTALGRALGIDDSEGEEDLQFWLREQHAKQMREHPGFMFEGVAS